MSNLSDGYAQVDIDDLPVAVRFVLQETVEKNAEKV